MIIVRNVFRLKFGKAKDALEAMRNLLVVSRRLGMPEPGRVMTDVTGPFYTLVHELTFASLEDLERGQGNMGDPAWKDAYAKFVPHVESGYREIFRVVE
jgi:predicted LPLAT superfamily acyltransferase